MEKIISTKIKSKEQMLAIASVLDSAMNELQLIEAFGLEDVSELLNYARELSCVKNKLNGWVFFLPPDQICRINLSLNMFLQPLYSLWSKVKASHTEFKQCQDKLCEHFDLSLEQSVNFFNQFGAYAEQKHNFRLANFIYEETINCVRIAEPIQRKSLLISLIINISRVEFMRGLSPIKTLKYQHEALRIVNQANLTAEDALLMLYTGMSEHFSGSFQEGYILRKKAIKYLRQFNYTDIESEVLPLEGWHYYLLGDFKTTIAHYESLILTIENREDDKIIAFAYPPIIFSYNYLGEYHKALILAEIIYENARNEKDHYAAILMLANIGRIYVYLDDINQAETILYQAYAEALQEDYGWGKYYTLFGICYLQYKKKNYFACREALYMATKVAQEHEFTPINASPYVIDVLKMMEDMGMEPVEGFDYKNVLQRNIVSDNIHMAGISYRHLAILGKKAGKSSEEILKNLMSSIMLLEKSGNRNELAASYVECAREFLKVNELEQARHYAQLAWTSQTEIEHKMFPTDLIGIVETKDYPLDLPILLETLWLELRHIINPERLIARLLTTICRQIKAESGAFVQIRNGKPSLIFSQNIDRDVTSVQYQRIMSTITQIEKTNKILIVKNKEMKNQPLTLIPKINPKFIICAPFSRAGRINAVLYFESYYKDGILTDAESTALKEFTDKLADHLFATLNYSETFSANVKSVHGTHSYDGANGEYCASVDETILLIEEQIEKVAKTKVPILITGETGVGKEIFCNEIFEKSGCKGSLIKVNCGAIPETLVESELFGYERGSFTGADKQKKGYFEAADGGTIFLDEIGELSQQTQIKLLRVLQEHEFTRVGGTAPQKVDFRLIAATNKNIENEVDKGNFRRDLYYRINVVQLEIPPLRERKSDIPLMTNFFIDKFCKELGRPSCKISPEALADLVEYEWPGNIRQLENTIYRSVLLTKDGMITKPLFGKEIITKGNNEPMLSLEEVERKHILEVLRACGGKVGGLGGAAEILGIKRTTLNSRMKKLGIKYNSKNNT